MSDEAETAFAFWTAPIGGLLISVLFTLPKECTGSIVANNRQCTSYLGLRTMVLDQASSLVLGVVVGAACWGLVTAYKYVNRPAQ